MKPDAHMMPKKLEPLWRAILGNCTIECYDFKRYSDTSRPEAGKTAEIHKIKL